MNVSPLNVAGQRFGRLLAMKRAKNIGRFTAWDCLCDCGNHLVIRTGSLRSGNTTSCGCLRAEQVSARFTKHGQKHSPEYASWSLMRDRCNNKNNKNFAWYGGAGIKVCEAWDDFSVFLSDMGYRPSAAHSIDRWPDQAGNYGPSNCRWATRTEQARNRRSTKLLEHNGITRPLAEWAEIFGIDYSILNKRIWRGWPVERALTERPRST